MIYLCCMSSKNLPQYTRLFTANLIHALKALISKGAPWAILIFVVVLNGYTVGWRVPQKLFRSLFSKATPIIESSSHVLGTSTNAKNTISQKEKIQSTYEYWKSITEEYPDYRDGHIQVALSAYQLGKFNEYEEHLNIAKLLDPNYPQISTIEKLERPK